MSVKKLELLDAADLFGSECLSVSVCNSFLPGVAMLRHWHWVVVGSGVC